jgi:hypothetical protein
MSGQKLTLLSICYYRSWNCDIFSRGARFSLEGKEFLAHRSDRTPGLAFIQLTVSPQGKIEPAIEFLCAQAGSGRPAFHFDLASV